MDGRTDYPPPFFLSFCESRHSLITRWDCSPCPPTPTIFCSSFAASSSTNAVWQRRRERKKNCTSFKSLWPFFIFLCRIYMLSIRILIFLILFFSNDVYTTSLLSLCLMTPEDTESVPRNQSRENQNRSDLAIDNLYLIILKAGSCTFAFQNQILSLRWLTLTLMLLKLVLFGVFFLQLQRPPPLPRFTFTLYKSSGAYYVRHQQTR